AELVERVVQAVYHHVANEHHRRFRNAFQLQRFVRIARWREQQVHKAIGNDAVDLLRHTPVTAAKPCLDMRRTNPQLHRHEHGGNRGIHIAIYHNPVWPVLHEHWLHTLHDARGLYSMRSGTNLQVEVWLGQAQVAEECRTHGIVVVLTRMHHQLLQIARTRRPKHRRKLAKVRTRSNYVKNLHRLRLGTDRITVSKGLPMASSALKRRTA